MIIRPARIGDLDVLTRMNIDLRADEHVDNTLSEEDVKERMSGFILDNIYSVYIFENKGEILGYSVVDITRTPPYMRQFFIQRGSRRQGLGRSCFNLLLDELSVENIDVEVLSWNSGAIAFYEALGFKPRYSGLRYTHGNP